MPNYFFNFVKMKILKNIFTLEHSVPIPATILICSGLYKTNLSNFPDEENSSDSLRRENLQ